MTRERPLLLPFLALAAGLTSADSFHILLPFTAVAAAFCCLILSCFIRNHLPLIICTVTFFFIWGLYALTPWKTPPVSFSSIKNYAARTPVVVEGIIKSRPVATSTVSSFVLEVETVIRDGISVKASGNLLVYVSRGDLSVTRGDLVRCMTRISIPHRLGLPGEFDYSRYLAFRNIAATGRIETAKDVVLMRGAAQESLLRTIDLVAQHLGDFIRRSVPNAEVSSVLTALLIGDQKRIPPQLADSYTRAGVNHILSISGFHVGIVSFFIVQLAMLAAIRFEFLVLACNLRRVVLLLSLPAMLFYLLLAGAAPAMARSVIMLGAYVWALYSERETDPVNVLLLSALLLVAINPPTLFDISFQLSFLALWGIIIISNSLLAWFNSIERNYLRTLTQFTLTSLAACFATAVPVLFIFNQASLNGIISNFLIVPLLGYGAVLTGFCALPFVYLFTPAAHLLLWLAGEMVVLSNWLIMWFAHMPMLRFHGITRLDMALFLATMSVMTFVHGRRWKVGFCVLLPSLAVIVHLGSVSAVDGRLHVTMLSVGQCESLLLRLPDGSTMLVDGGGYLHDNGRDFGERVLAPALFKLGVRRIDRMVMTHSHPDHIGGLSFATRTFPVGEFWEAAPGGSGEQYGHLRATLAENGVPMRSLSGGDFIKLPGGVSMIVLSPPRTTQRNMTQTTNDSDMNEDSLVFKLNYGTTSILFTADTGFPTEERMLRGNARLLSSDVLKVGHHGSRYSTSEAFLDRVTPKVALISAGRDNAFGLPSPHTINHLEKRGIKVLRTDRDGTIELVSDGKNWSSFTRYRPD